MQHPNDTANIVVLVFYLLRGSMAGAGVLSLLLGINWLLRRFAGQKGEKDAR